MYHGYLFGSLKDWLMSKISKGTAKWPRFDGSSIFSYACDVVSHDIGKMSNYGPGVQELIFRGVLSLDSSRHTRHEDKSNGFYVSNNPFHLAKRQLTPHSTMHSSVHSRQGLFRLSCHALEHFFGTFKKAIADFSAQIGSGEPGPPRASQSHFWNTLWLGKTRPCIGSFTHTFHHTIFVQFRVRESSPKLPHEQQKFSYLHHDHCAAVVGLEIFEGHSRSHFCLRWDARNPNHQWTISVEHWNWEQNHTSNKEQGYSSPTSSSPIIIFLKDRDFPNPSIFCHEKNSYDMNWTGWLSHRDPYFMAYEIILT